MITHVRSRGLSDPPYSFHDSGYRLVKNSELGIYEPKRVNSSTSDFLADDFKLQDQLNLGMNLKPTKVPSDNFAIVDSISSALTSVQIDEFSNLQTAVESTPSVPPIIESTPNTSE